MTEKLKRLPQRYKKTNLLSVIGAQVTMGRIQNRSKTGNARVAGAFLLQGRRLSERLKNKPN
jgi:hypothetical protein